MCEIKLKIHEENDLYNPLDPDRELLSDEVVSYIVRKYSEKNVRGSHVIRIISDTPLDEERVRKNIRRYTEQEDGIVSRKQKSSSLKQLWLALIGVAFIAVWLILAANTENVIVEVLSIIGSFAIWEAANIWIVERPSMRLERLRLKRLMDTEIIFVYKEN